MDQERGIADHGGREDPHGHAVTAETGEQERDDGHVSPLILFVLAAMSFIKIAMLPTSSEAGY
jgi:hypothetical protein